MSFVAPIYLLAAVAIAGAVTLLHFIVMRDPPSAVFPTARFIPSRPVLTRSVSSRPENLLLLLLRVIAVVAIGTAFARPSFSVWHTSVLTIVVVDRSRSVGDVGLVADSARRVLRSFPHGTLVFFDSTARVIDGQRFDSLAETPSFVRGSISAALITALREASRQRDRADSIELVLISPLAWDEVDDATDSIRSLWPGSIHLIRAPMRQSAPSGQTAPMVNWPTTGRAPGVVPRPTVDTVGAVIAGDVVVVAPFVRAWRLDVAGARILARWVDGEPAAIERSSSGQQACEHDVAIPVTDSGDLTLRPEFRRLVTRLSAPCGYEPAAPRSTAGWWDPTQPTRLRVPAREIAPNESRFNPITVWLLAVATLALIGEVITRRYRGQRT